MPPDIADVQVKNRENVQSICPVQSMFNLYHDIFFASILI
jgi:hypothetical protein